MGAVTKSVTVTVASVSDTTPPTVSLTSPLNGATVTRKSTVTLSATAADEMGVTKVEFWVNGALLCTDTAAPYTCAWKVPNAANKTYILQAKASDAAGNLGTSASVSVTSR